MSKKTNLELNREALVVRPARTSLFWRALAWILSKFIKLTPEQQLDLKNKLKDDFKSEE
jgi:hypothetical protein